MSLDVYLNIAEPFAKEPSSGIYVRDGGSTREVTRAEWDEMAPGREPVTFKGVEFTTEVFTRNITHNLTTMAFAAGLYDVMWRPDEHGIEKADDLIDPLTKGLNNLLSDPDRFEKMNPVNGWGSYDGLVNFVVEYIKACRKWPHAKVSVCR